MRYIRYRYIAIRILDNSTEDIYKELISRLEKSLGHYIKCGSMLKIIKKTPINNKINVLRVNHKYLDNLIAVLTTFEIDGKIEILGVSNTLKTLIKRLKTGVSHGG